MGNKKAIIFSLVAFIALVAVTALVLKARLSSGTTAAAPGKTLASDISPVSSESAVTDEVLPLSAVAVPVSMDDTSLSVMPSSEEAPRQVVIEEGDAIPSKAIQISVSDKGFSPAEFTVKAGQSVTLAISSVDSNTHVFLFPNASLMGLTMAVLSGETKTISFTAPAAGSFLFRDDIPGYRENTGMMIVE